MSAPRSIISSPAEITRGRYSAATLQSALEALHKDGVVVLKSVVSVSHIEHLHTVMSSQTEGILQSKQRSGLFNQGVNSNILQQPPMDQEDCLFDDVWFNPFIVQIANAYLGATPIMNFVTGNNALHHTSNLRQPVHKDITFKHPQCPFYFIANFPLSPFSPATGSTEFWPGSHAHTSSADQIPCTESTRVRKQVVGVDPSCNVRPEVVEARRQIRQPVQPTCAPGDVLIRDLRTWHAGMPNESAEDRIMIALGYQAPWYPNHKQKLYLPLKHANFFMEHAGQPVEVRANLLEEGQVEKVWENYDFDFGPSV